MYIIENLPENMRSLFYTFQAPVMPHRPANTLIPLKKILLQYLRIKQNKLTVQRINFGRGKWTTLRLAQRLFSTYQPFSIKYPNNRVRNDPTTRAFSEIITL